MEAVWLLPAIVAVVAAWVVAIFLVRNWGAGYGARNVHCPHKGVRATISTVNIASGAGIRRDVLRCSLLPEQPVTCDKSCLAQL
jgi:hypothetical protein